MIAFRSAEARDRNFIVDSWLQSFRTAPSAGLIQMADWRNVMWPQLEKALDRPDVRTLVAYETDDDTPGLADLYGFVAADTTLKRPLIYYAFVKQAYRRAGVMRGLCAEIGVDLRKPLSYACKTNATRELERAGKIPLAKWDSLAARFPKTEEGTP